MEFIYTGNNVFLLFGVVVACFVLFYFIFRMLKGRGKVIDNVTDPAKLNEMANEFAEQKNFKKEIKCYHKAAEQGNKDAQLALGVMYNIGHGVPQDDKAAVKYYKLAAEQGNAKAQYNLGVAYTEGKGVRQDDKVAVEYYKLAVEQGHAKAQYNLGVMYYRGQGLPQDDKAAVKYIKLAAEQGHAPALDLLRK